MPAGTVDDRGLQLFDTAAGLWPELAARAGLTGGQDGQRGPYDAGLLSELQRLLFPDEEGELDALIAASGLSAEALVRALFATLEPFARMKEDILAMLAEAGASASGDSLAIRFNFDSGTEPLDLLLEQFRSQMERFAMALAPALPRVNYLAMWALARAGFEDKAGSVAPPPSAAVLAWLDRYADGTSFPQLTGSYATGVVELDRRLDRVVGFLNSLLARFAMHGRDHEELRRAADAAPSLPGEGGELSVHELWILESDFWPRAIAHWICQVHSAVRVGETERYPAICKHIDDILPEMGGQRSALIRVLEDILDLPVWKRRHEVYAVWLGAQIHQALSGHGWRFRFHLVEGRLEFAFRGAHLATLVRSEHEPELYWWTELRSAHPDLPSGHRSTGIQPDYRVRRSPLSDPTPDVLVVEAKQHLRSSTREFRDAIEDYTHACPGAGVVLANHGPCVAGLLAGATPAARLRAAAHGGVQPGNAEVVAAFRGDAASIVDHALAGTIAQAFELPSEVTLSWGAVPTDLDLHVVRDDGRALSYEDPRWENAELSADAQSGNGRETARLPARARVWRVVVHQYSEDGALSDSDAVVEIASGPRWNRARKAFEVVAGHGRWWHVAEIDQAGNAICLIQTRSDSRDG